VPDGTELHEVSPQFVAALERRRLPVRAIADEVAATGSVQGVAAVPADLRRLFRTAHEIPGA
jgi:ribonucleoside-diphosphate reductase alpha chain